MRVCVLVLVFVWFGLNLRFVFYLLYLRCVCCVSCDLFGGFVFVLHDWFVLYCFIVFGCYFGGFGCFVFVVVLRA